MIKPTFARLRRLEAEIYLPAARTVLFVAALLCALGVGIGLLVAGYFDVSSRQSATRVTLPQEYEQKQPKIELEGIRARLIGPTNIRFEVFANPVSSAEEAAAALGKLLADTPNGLARKPQDFELLGGTDIDYFELVHGLEPGTSYFVPGRDKTLARLPPFTTGLAGTDKFLELIGKAQEAGGVHSRTFEIRIRARDTLGNTSPPQNLRFEVRFGPAPLPTPEPDRPPPPVQTAPPEPEPQQQTPLEKLAREIALAVDPERGANFVDVRAKALLVPQQCGSSPYDAIFVWNFEQAFTAVKGLLTLANVSRGFFPSVCQAWRAAVEHERQAAAAAQAERLKVQAAYELERLKVEAANVASRALRNGTLTFVLAAVVVLLLLSLPIGLLLIESHSQAMRRIVERLEADSARQRPPQPGEMPS